MGEGWGEGPCNDEKSIRLIAPMPAGAARRKHRELFPKLIDLLKNVWRCQSITVDATAIGPDIASFLADALGADLVHPFVFSAVSKSDLGYQLLSAVNSGPLKIPRPPPFPMKEGRTRVTEEKNLKVRPHSMNFGARRS